MSDEETTIWNRACDIRGFSPTLGGDTALRWAISFNGVACNGGVIHSLEFHAKNIAEVFDAFRTLGAQEMPSLLTALKQRYAAASQDERTKTERAFDRQYHTAMNDKRLTELFQALYKTSPNLFERP